MPNERKFNTGDYVIVRFDPSCQDVDCILPVLHDFCGKVVAINEDGTMDVDDADSLVFDSIDPEFVDVECQGCFKPMRVYVADLDGTNLEEVYGCPDCD